MSHIEDDDEKREGEVDAGYGGGGEDKNANSGVKVVGKRWRTAERSPEEERKKTKGENEVKSKMGRRIPKSKIELGKDINCLREPIQCII